MSSIVEKWHVRDWQTRVEIRCARGVIANLDSSDFTLAQDAVNAARIVKAVNCHDDLCAALRATLTAYDKLEGIQDGDLAHAIGYSVREALKQAAVQQNKMPPERVCAWCRKDIDTGEQLTDKEYEATTVPGAQVSHAICPVCREKHFLEESPSEAV